MGTASARVVLSLSALALANLCLADGELDAHRARWHAAGILEYQYRYQKVCECHREKPADTIVSVSQGRVVDVRYDREDFLAEIAIAKESYKWFRTVEDLFMLVERALERQALVRVSYEPDLGYPTSIFIDYDKAMVGEEVELLVLGLQQGD